MRISDFDYPLPDERIAKFPLGARDASKLLVWRNGEISETTFSNIASELPAGSLLVFNNTRVVRARLIFRRPSALNAPPDSRHAYAADANIIAAPTPGARIEILCLEPHNPADYERAFAAKNHCEWVCMIGNAKKWKGGAIEYDGLRAFRSAENPAENIVRFEWDSDLSFGELLEQLGRVPIPPYLGRDSAEIDNTRYQTVYSRFEGSVAAPTAGLHFTPELIEKLKQQDTIFRQSGADVALTAGFGGEDSTQSTGSPTKQGSATGAPLSRKIEFDEVTLHVGAGTFLPVKAGNALDHPMHTEHFEVTLATVEHLLAKRRDGQGRGKIIAVGTTSVRTLESLVALGWRIAQTGSPETDLIETPVGQFEPGDIPKTFDGAAALKTLADYMLAKNLQKITAATRIMITPGFTFRIVDGIITNFHQPKSTLLLLVSAFTNNNWRKIYDYALAHDFRFLSYGDSSLLLRSL